MLRHWHTSCNVVEHRVIVGPDTFCAQIEPFTFLAEPCELAARCILPRTGVQLRDLANMQPCWPELVAPLFFLAVPVYRIHRFVLEIGARWGSSLIGASVDGRAYGPAGQRNLVSKVIVGGPSGQTV